ncbi:uncharacterized protein LTR77_004129 [Saxophila tyrrhenica]|uniref:NAD(P)-binding protein n=1 Tax=Saxophila tyrrhenica TaxID=1690608 RepID=A0AAV9PCL1_9PEZI|nr:hypothetical protein LTR77_004129 [Saxophila tyrrhenica]
MAERWALITGVSKGGLGDALLHELLSRNINVIATGPTLAQLDYLKPKANNTAKLEKLELDVTSPTSITAAATAVRHLTNSRLNYLINNAGYGYMHPLLDASILEIRHNFDVNVFGLLAVTQAFFPMLRVAKGVVVNQASIAGLPGICQPFIGSYSASKAAVVGLNNTLRVELVPFGVRVVTLVTGDVNTQFWGHVEGGSAGIPESSSYQPIKDHVNAMLRGTTKPGGARSPAEWAKGVAKDLLVSNPPSHIYRGFLATTMWWVSWLMPIWLLDWLFARETQITKLKSILEAEEQGGKKQQ